MMICLDGVEGRCLNGIHLMDGVNMIVGFRLRLLTVKSIFKTVALRSEVPVHSAPPKVSDMMSDWKNDVVM